jgi:hypothetical protein
VKAKRPKSRGPTTNSPVKDCDRASLEALASQAVYLGSAKHKWGKSWLGVGRPGFNALSTDQANQDDPTPPYTMVCPEKWNRLDPTSEATCLLREAILKGQIGHPIVDGLPKVVWARDPDDPSIVYRARQLTPGGREYKAFPLTKTEVLLIGMIVS